MNIIEKAKTFAIKAHMGRYTRSDKSVLEVIHPMLVARILKKFGCRPELIAAAYLHDVLEDTKCCSDDILKEFGYDVYCLVESASEPKMEQYVGESDEEFWIRRKTFMINRTRSLPLESKLLICADKIQNITRLIYEFRTKGKEDWILYKTGRNNQLWFFTSMYNSLIEGQNPNHPLFEMLRLSIEELKVVCLTKKELEEERVEINYCKVYQLKAA